MISELSAMIINTISAIANSTERSGQQFRLSRAIDIIANSYLVLFDPANALGDSIASYRR